MQKLSPESDDTSEQLTTIKEEAEEAVEKMNETITTIKGEPSCWKDCPWFDIRKDKFFFRNLEFPFLVATEELEKIAAGIENDPSVQDLTDALEKAEDLLEDIKSVNLEDDGDAVDAELAYVIVFLPALVW